MRALFLPMLGFTKGKTEREKRPLPFPIFSHLKYNFQSLFCTEVSTGGHLSSFGYIWLHLDIILVHLGERMHLASATGSPEDIVMGG